MSDENAPIDEQSLYLCRLRFNATVIFVVWYSAERDGFIRDAAGRLLAASDPETLTAAIKARGLRLEEDEPADYDFDRIRTWCANPDKTRIDCRDFLDTWNFFDDLAGRPGDEETLYVRLSRAADKSYKKLFWGSNLPAVTPPGERFTPNWGADELHEIRLIFEAGLDLLNSSLPGSVEKALPENQS